MGVGERDSSNVPLPSLYISRDAGDGWLIALDHGRVCDGHPPEQFRGVTDECGYMLDRPGGRRVIGFVVHGLREFVPPPRLFRAPHFDASMFGLTRATAGEIILAVQARLLDEPTVNRVYFSAAINAA